MSGSTIFAILAFITLVLSVAGQWYMSRQDDELYSRSRALRKLNERTGEDVR